MDDGRAHALDRLGAVGDGEDVVARRAVGLAAVAQRRPWAQGEPRVGHRPHEVRGIERRGRLDSGAEPALSVAAASPSTNVADANMAGYARGRSATSSLHSLPGPHRRRRAAARSTPRPAVGVVGGPRHAPVCAGDRLHDRQPEAAAAARARLIGAREALERLRDELRREARALVAHVQLDRGRPRPRAARWIVAVARAAGRCRPGCRAPARARRAVGRELRPPAPSTTSSRRSPRAGREARRYARPAARRCRAAAGASGARRRRRGRSRAAPRRARRGGRSPRRPTAARRAALPRATAAQRQLELGLEDRQRRAQLVTRVGDEGALALEGVLEAREHARSASSRAGRSRRPRGRTGSRSPGVVLGDLVGLAAHRARPAAAPPRRRRSRPATRAGAPPARRSQQEPRLSQRRVAVVGVGADDDDQLAARAPDGRGEQARRLAEPRTVRRA